jgi:glucan phosphorylase
MFRFFNTIPGALLLLSLLFFSTKKADATWWNWSSQPTSEEKCETYVKQQLENHPKPFIKKHAWIIAPEVVEVIKRRNNNYLSKEAAQIYIQSNLQSTGLSSSTSKWISKEASNQIEQGRFQSDCSQIK